MSFEFNRCRSVYVKFYLIYFRFAVVIAKRSGVALFSRHAVDYDYVLNNDYLPAVLQEADLCFISRVRV